MSIVRSILWESFVGGSQSLGIVGENTILALDRLGFEVVVRPWNLSPILRSVFFCSENEADAEGYAWGDDALERMQPRTRAIVRKSMSGISIAKEQESDGITWGGIERLEQIYWRHAAKRYGYIFYDYTWMSRRHTNACNRMDTIFVPSEFVKSVAKDSGVHVPIHVWPHGVNVASFSDDDRDETSFSDSICTFLFIGVVQRRKGIEELLSAFTRAFDTGKQDVRLVIKSAHWGAVDTYRARYPDDRIRWIHKNLPQDALKALIRSADCIVLPSRGEAFALPLLEALAMGVPVVYTDHGGHRDFCDGSVGYAVDVERFSPIMDSTRAKYWGYSEVPRWAIPSVDCLVETLRHVSRNRDEARVKGRAGRARAGQWTWDAGVRKVYGVLTDLHGST